MTPAVALEDVRFAYPDGTVALDGVSLEFPPGSRAVIVGQNGSGKSTLVRQLDGLLRPSSGRVTHDGRDVAGRHVAELARTVGLVFQDPARQIFAGRVRGEVGFGPRNLGRRGPELERAVDAALAAVGLAGEADQNPYDLGLSRRKLLALASVLAMETPVLVLDEPTTGQDADGVRLVEAIVADVAATGRTVIAISHDLRFAAEAFERVVVMRTGRVVLDGPPAEVLDASNGETLAATYLEPPLPARVGARLGIPGTPTDALLLSSLRRTGRETAGPGRPTGSP